MNIDPKYTFNKQDDELIAQFTTFMMKAVRHARIDYIRRQRYWNWEIATDRFPQGIEASALLERWIDAVPDDSFYFLEERIERAFYKLSSLRRRILELYFIEEMSPEEIAKVIKKSVRFVYNQKYIALIKLKRELLNGASDE